VADWFHASDAHELVAIVPVIPEPGWTASLSEWARGHGVPLVESGHWRDLPADLGALDLGISIFYDKILRAEFIDRFGRLLNLHNGPLPRYRGVAPINWALKNEEDHHGVTIHEVTPGIDDGPVVSQVTYSIYPEVDEVREVYARALQFGWTLFEQTLPMLDRIEARPQDETEATYYTAGDQERLGDRASFTREQSASRT
jgi:methionyl-tRNA formyltransferase